MYDPTETDLSFKELSNIFSECTQRGISVAVVGGWATFIYVNPTYKRAFGQDYMGSRDIDIFFDPRGEQALATLIKELGFQKNGFPFRYEKIYDREKKQFITQDQAKKEPIFNLIYIFLDLFSSAETREVRCWWDLTPLQTLRPVQIKDFFVADINTLVCLKCIALFARDKADKENKDACDLYALLQYSEKEIEPTQLLEKAITKILARQDLIYIVADQVLLDQNRQNIVRAALKAKLDEIQKKLLYK